MSRENDVEMIRKISLARGASGFEDEVVDAIRPYAAPLGALDEDPMRNLFLSRRENTGNRPVVMLDAHTDEVSFMVKAIKPNGTLQFIPLGGWVRQAVAGQQVKVRARSGAYITGVIGTTPPHFMTEAEKNAAPDLSAMYIDVGARSREEAIRDFDIGIGEPVVPSGMFEYQPEHGLLFGKAFDCRLGCAAVLGTLQTLAGEALSVDITASFSSQEEVGTRGATVAVQRIKPAAAIIFEGCPADDTAVEKWASQTALKCGPMLRYIDARMITHPRFQRFALKTGETHNIPVQASVRSGGSTDGAPVHLTHPGVPCIVIGLPVRYIHTHHCISAMEDYISAVRLAAEVLRALNADVLKNF